MSIQVPLYPLTPSRYHEQARNHPAGHDRIKQELLAFLRDRPLAAIPECAAVHREVEAERPLHRRGQIVSYVDAVEIVTVNLSTTVSLFEVKPQIDTIFGIIRQAKAMLALARADIPGDVHVCHLVVPHTDPLLAALRAEWPHTWAWGVRFGEGGE